MSLTYDTPCYFYSFLMEGLLWTTKGEVQKHVSSILGCGEEGIFTVTKGSFVAAANKGPFGHVGEEEKCVVDSKWTRGSSGSSI